MHNIEKNLISVHSEINRACEQFGRKSPDVTLLAVSKTKPAKDIELAHHFGQLNFGESYLQEAEEKITQLENMTDIIWHYIGPIQSNKTAKISALFDWVHSVDRVKIARRLNQQRPDNLPALNVLLQVNIDREADKSGIQPEQIRAMAKEIVLLPRLRLRGLMTIPALEYDFDRQQVSFKEMALAMDELQQDFPDCDTLSMGMSGDMKAAIAQGSTLVRIGTAIFGSRESKNNS